MQVRVLGVCCCVGVVRKAGAGEEEGAESGEQSARDITPPIMCPRCSPLDPPALSLLADMALAYPGDALLAGLVRSLDACKLPRVRLAILEYAASHLGRGRAAGVPSSANHIK